MKILTENRFQILNVDVCILRSIYILRKCDNPNIIPQAMSKLLDRLKLLNLVTSLGEEIFWIQTMKPRLKHDLVSSPACAKWVYKYLDYRIQSLWYINDDFFYEILISVTWALPRDRCYVKILFRVCHDQV